MNVGGSRCHMQIADEGWIWKYAVFGRKHGGYLSGRARPGAGAGARRVCGRALRVSWDAGRERRGVLHARLRPLARRHGPGDVTVTRTGSGGKIWTVLEHSFRYIPHPTHSENDYDCSRESPGRYVPGRGVRQMREEDMGGVRAARRTGDG